MDDSDFISTMHGWTAKICSAKIKSGPFIAEHGWLEWDNRIPEFDEVSQTGSNPIIKKK